MKTATGSLVIRNGQIIDGTGAAAVPDGVVVIEDGRISYAGSATYAPELPAGAQQIDANGGSSGSCCCCPWR